MYLEFFMFFSVWNFLSWTPPSADVILLTLFLSQRILFDSNSNLVTSYFIAFHLQYKLSASQHYKFESHYSQKILS